MIPATFGPFATGREGRLSRRASRRVRELVARRTRVLLAALVLVPSALTFVMWLAERG
jgi:hypothetical protein